MSAFHHGDACFILSSTADGYLQRTSSVIPLPFCIFPVSEIPKLHHSDSPSAHCVLSHFNKRASGFSSVPLCSTMVVACQHSLRLIALWAHALQASSASFSRSSQHHFSHSGLRLADASQFIEQVFVFFLHICSLLQLFSQKKENCPPHSEGRIWSWKGNCPSDSSSHLSLYSGWSPLETSSLLFLHSPSFFPLVLSIMMINTSPVYIYISDIVKTYIKPWKEKNVRAKAEEQTEKKIISVWILFVASAMLMLPRM